MQKHRVAQTPERYLAWPDVCLTRAGKLVAIFTACDHHGNRDHSQLMLAESTNRGRTWGEMRPFSSMSMRGDYWNCARIQRLPDDSLLAVCDRVYDESLREAKVFFWRGDPQGTSWSEPVDTGCRGILPDHVTILENGRWLMLTHWGNDDTGDLEVYAHTSDDQGRTWNSPVLAARQPGLNLCEASALQLPEGRIVVLMRENSALGLDCYKVFSDDNGESWHGLATLPLPGVHRPVVGRLQSGRYLVTYRFMQGGKGWLGAWTQNTFAAVLTEESLAAATRKEAWSRIMPLDYDRSPNSDCGYTGWVQFPDGELFIINYIVDDAPKAQIRGYSLREEDIML